MEWLALLIPIFAILGLWLLLPHKIVWWELIIPIIPALIIIPLCKAGAETVLTQDYERWGGWVTEVRYFEAWDEYIEQTCTREVEDGKDSEGRTKYRTESYDCSYVDYHPEYWEAHGSNGEVLRISEGHYQSISRRFGNNTFVDLHRHYHRNDGDMYSSRWPNTDQTFTVLFTELSYVNKVQANKGVYEFKQPNKKTASELYKFPALTDNFNDPAILGPHSTKDDALLQYYNARLGASHKIRIWILLFNNKPRSHGFEQEAYWRGGNKNELVICINTDNGMPTWCHPFCWSPNGYAGNDAARIEIRNYVEAQPSLVLEDVIKQTVSQVRKSWRKKSFKEFDYLTVDLPTGWLIAIFVLTTALTGGVCAFVILNDIAEPARRHNHTLSEEFSDKIKERLGWFCDYFHSVVIYCSDWIETFRR